MTSGQLVLLDIFSYSCMNCLRSLGFIKKIDSRYKKHGLKTALIHPPEWEFEKEKRNILHFSKKYGIRFPIIMDKEKKIINKLGISFWPAQILIKNGKILYKNVGDGNYKKLENSISQFLRIKNKGIFSAEPEYSKFPTLYCGKRKNGKLMNLKNRLRFGIIYKNGKWAQKDEYLKSNGKLSSLTMLTKGKVINFVAKSMSKKSVNVDVKLNGKLIKRLAIKQPQLYEIIKLKADDQQKLDLTANKRLAVYSFSFR